MSDPLITIERVGKSYARQGVMALSEITTSIAPGRFVSLIGPSGCGKSTLLKIVGGLLEPSDGEVRIAGRRIDRPTRDVGFMFQKSTLIPWHSALQNVVLPIAIREGRAAARRARERGRALLEMAGVAGFESALPHELSGGMAQRVAICRMLITDPRVLLLDEPFGALDEITRDRMNVELQRIVTASDATSIMVTHSIQEAVFLSDVIYVMSPRPGRIATVIENPLPRPRTLEVTTSAAFQEIVARVRRDLDAVTGEEVGRVG